MPNINFVSAERFIYEYKTGGSHPSKILCSDGNIYIVKHAQLGRNYRHLINEFIGAEIGKAIGLNIPVFALVELPEYVFKEVPRFYHGIPSGLGFGSKHLEGFITEFDKFSKYSDFAPKDRYLIHKDFLLTCLFDIWLRNDDRSIGNCNSLFHEMEGSIRYYAIDHAAIFCQYDYNSLTLEKELIPPIGDTLFYHDFFLEIKDSLGIFFDQELSKLITKIELLDEQVVRQILSAVPEQWLLSDQDKIHIKDFVIFRKNDLRNQINILLNVVEQ